MTNPLRAGEDIVDATINRINNHDGMALRDWFAGQALASYNCGERGEWDIYAVASDCYRQADAMLKARVHSVAAESD